MTLDELLERQPFLPYIRESDYAVRSPWYFPERRLLDYLLVYFQEGHCRFEVDGETYDFFPGEFCLAQPNSVKTMRGLTPTVTPFAHLDLFYHPLRAQSFPTRAGQTDLRQYEHLLQPRLNDLHGVHVPVRLKPKQPDRMAGLMLRMIECWRDPSPLQRMKAQTVAAELMIDVLEDHHVRSEQPFATNAPALQWFPSYLSLHLAEPITVQDMARRANLSVSRFRAVFKQQFGMPPHRYLLELRIRHAKELLRNTGYSAERIAEYCGFADVHHFSKAFKQAVRVSPGIFRKQPRVSVSKHEDPGTFRHTGGHNP